MLIAFANLSTIEENLSPISPGISGDVPAACTCVGLSESAFTAAPPAAPSPNAPAPRASILPLPPTLLIILPRPLGADFFNPPPGISTSRFNPPPPEGEATGRLDNCFTILIIT